VNNPSHDPPWQTFVAQHPEAHILQTAEWGQLKADFGWRVEHIIEGDTGAQILFRSFLGIFTLAYIPRGPVGELSEQLIAAIDTACRRKRAFALKIEPDEPQTARLDEKLRAFGYRPSPHMIQPRRTLTVDLTPDEDEIMMNMHQKTRYNVRLSGRKQVEVRAWEDISGFCRMISSTAAREGFGAHSAAYYQRAYELFHPQGCCELFVAEYQSEPLAAIMVFAHGPRSWYLYGASTTQERNRMPTYQLQWEAMRWAKAKGCRSYDLWGVPDADLETLEAEFTSRRDGLWGVYRFKRGFGGELVRSAGAWDRPYNRLVYWTYRRLVSLQRGL
jgi:lipid II:glycine glycyltransferase (peptidoglycan interpeptide bridge formation enzyme)